jgi:hypothetical protein
MTIQYKYFDGRYTQYRSTEVHKRAKFSGHEIFADADGWLYVQNNAGDWQYFGTIREARNFIRNTYWGD